MTMAVLFSLSLCSATVFDETFGLANSAYMEDDFQAAINYYEQLVSDGVVNADLFYNLGNAYYRVGRIGPAIANYERARHLRPGFDAAERNLQQCLEETQRQLGAPLPPPWQQALLFWHAGLAPTFSFASAVLSWILFWSLLAIRLWRPLRYLRLAAALFAILTVLFGLSSWVKEHPPQLAVANADRVPVRYGIGADETTRFELYAGDRVRVEKRANGWARVAAADGERGWVDESSLTVVGPPYLRPRDEVNSDSEEPA
jgi:tetratricopeptide (TPR) repeat protein